MTDRMLVQGGPPEASPAVVSTPRMQPYWVSIFLGAFLLFSVQLLLGKYFLPWFGGTPAMWTTCMFFFQTMATCIPFSCSQRWRCSLLWRRSGARQSPRVSVGGRRAAIIRSGV